MSKRNKQTSGRANALNRVGNTRSTILSGKRKILRLAWILALCLFIVGGVTVALFLDKTTWVDTDGVLHEPLFGLVPVSCFFLCVAIVLALLDMAINLRKRR